MRKVGRKTLALTGALFILGFVFVILGLLWAVLDRNHYYSESVRHDRCDHNRMRIDAGMEGYRALHGLTNGAPVDTADFIEFVEGGWATLKCPGGGTYKIGAVGEKAVCSLHR
jgi:hypothetical protein